MKHAHQVDDAVGHVEDARVGAVVARELVDLLRDDHPWRLLGDGVEDGAQVLEAERQPAGDGLRGEGRGGRKEGRIPDSSTHVLLQTRRGNPAEKYKMKCDRACPHLRRVAREEEAVGVLADAQREAQLGLREVLQAKGRGRKGGTSTSTRRLNNHTHPR